MKPDEIFRYEGGPEMPAALEQFVDVATQDPGSVSQVLRFIDKTTLPLAGALDNNVPPPPEEFIKMLQDEHKARQDKKPNRKHEELSEKALIRKGRALLVVWGLFIDGADKEIDYPRPVEHAISENERISQLKRERDARRTDNAKEAVIKIRAGRLATALGCLSTGSSTKKKAQNNEQEGIQAA